MSDTNDYRPFPNNPTKSGNSDGEGERWSYECHPEPNPLPEAAKPKDDHLKVEGGPAGISDVKQGRSPDRLWRPVGVGGGRLDE